jgi:hypothetical protein
MRIKQRPPLPGATPAQALRHLFEGDVRAAVEVTDFPHGAPGVCFLSCRSSPVRMVT